MGGGRWGALLLALVPWAAFLVTLLVADLLVGRVSVSLEGLVASAPVYLGFVAVPCLFPIVAVEHLLVRWAVVLVMTVTAMIAGVSVVATDDAQAGLAVLLVPFVALPLAFVVAVGELVAARIRRRR